MYFFQLTEAVSKIISSALILRRDSHNRKGSEPLFHTFMFVPRTV
jgi:hypothetical protein